MFGPTANRFDPHRETGHAAVPGYGLAFAAGTHTCIGRRLAMGTGDPTTGALGSLVTMALLLQRMDVRPDPAEAPTYDDGTFYDEYARFPVLLDPWGEAPAVTRPGGD